LIRLERGRGKRCAHRRSGLEGGGKKRENVPKPLREDPAKGGKRNKALKKKKGGKGGDVDYSILESKREGKRKRAPTSSL